MDFSASNNHIPPDTRGVYSIRRKQHPSQQLNSKLPTAKEKGRQDSRPSNKPSTTNISHPRAPHAPSAQKLEKDSALGFLTPVAYLPTKAAMVDAVLAVCHPGVSRSSPERLFSIPGGSSGALLTWWQNARLAQATHEVPPCHSRKHDLKHALL